MLTTGINFGEIYFLTNFCIFFKGFLISVFSQENAFSGGFSCSLANQGVQLKYRQL